MTTPDRTRAILFFGVPERDVDLITDALTDASAKPLRYIVFGNDFHLLGALEKFWRDRVDMAIVYLPAGVDIDHDVPLTILENERLDVGEVLWVCSDEAALPPPPGMDALIMVRGEPARESAARIAAHLACDA